MGGGNRAGTGGAFRRSRSAVAPAAPASGAIRRNAWDVITKAETVSAVPLSVSWKWG
ncbi:hypothetical protein AGMMS49940_08780 [Spirochaetia bacterium]|nr:hypothetical protein AGMMS49940_08780 [Spirochaetia bacterium]